MPKITAYISTNNEMPPIGGTLTNKDGVKWYYMPFTAMLDGKSSRFYRVKYGGKTTSNGQGGVSSRITVLAALDASDILKRFVYEGAISGPHMWDMPAPVLEYLNDPIDERKRDALDAINDTVDAICKVAREVVDSGDKVSKEMQEELLAAWAAKCAVEYFAFGEVEDAIECIRAVVTAFTVDKEYYSNPVLSGTKRIFDQRIRDAFEELDNA